MCDFLWQQQTQYQMYDLMQSARANVLHFYAILCSDELKGVAITSTTIVLVMKEYFGKFGETILIKWSL